MGPAVLRALGAIVVAPLEVGDRLLLAPGLSGLGHPAWARVEVLEFHSRPGDLPWNSGPRYPYRAGYVIEDPDLIHDGARRGVVWLDASGGDGLGAVLESRRSSDRQFAAC